MSVYKKLQQARMLLQGAKLTKSGKNKFAGYEYFELSDFLPAIQKMGKKLTEKYGTGVIFKSVGGAMEGVKLSKNAQKYGMTNKTAKTDVEVIDAVTGKTIDLLSVKCGEGQASSGNWQDNYAGIMWAADTAKEMGMKVTKDEQKASDNFMEFIRNPRIVFETIC